MTVFIRYMYGMVSVATEEIFAPLFLKIYQLVSALAYEQRIDVLTVNCFQIIVVITD